MATKQDIIDDFEKWMRDLRTAKTKSIDREMDTRKHRAITQLFNIKIDTVADALKAVETIDDNPKPEENKNGRGNANAGRDE